MRNLFLQLLVLDWKNKEVTNSLERDKESLQGDFKLFPVMKLPELVKFDTLPFVVMKTVFITLFFFLLTNGSNVEPCSLNVLTVESRDTFAVSYFATQNCIIFSGQSQNEEGCSILGPHCISINECDLDYSFGNITLVSSTSSGRFLYAFLTEVQVGISPNLATSTKATYLFTNPIVIIATVTMTIIL